MQRKRASCVTNPVAVPDWRSWAARVFTICIIAALEQALLGTNTVCDNEPEADPLSEASKAEALAVLRSNGLVQINKSLRSVRFHKQPSKRWPAERYASR